MTSAAFPTVIAAVFPTATSTLPTARVVRGRDISNNPGDVLMVGVADPDDPSGWDDAGTYEQSQHTFGGKRLEEGRVNCVAKPWNGNSAPSAAEAAVFAMIAALEASVATSPSLGVSSFDFLEAEVESGMVRESTS